MRNSESILKRSLGALLLWLPTLALAQEEGGGAATSKSSGEDRGLIAAYLGQTPVQWSVFVAITVLAFFLGFFIYTRLLPKQMPSSAGRFGCFWFVFFFLLFHFLMAVFWLLVHPSALLITIVIVVLIIWLIVLYNKKK